MRREHQGDLDTSAGASPNISQIDLLEPNFSAVTQERISARFRKGLPIVSMSCQCLVIASKAYPGANYVFR